MWIEIHIKWVFLVMEKKNLIYTVPVRYFDLDTNQHVNNAVYFTYMEEARTKLLLKEFLALQGEGIGFVVTEAKCKYLKPIRIQDTVTIKISIENVRGISFDIKYVFENESGKLYAEGNTTLACIDIQTQKLRRMPLEIVEALHGLVQP
jgi:acyl-CoA thioester hydrolase